MEGPDSKFSFFKSHLAGELMPLPFPCKIVFPIVQRPFGLFLPFLQILSATHCLIRICLSFNNFFHGISSIFLLFSLSFVHFSFFRLKNIALVEALLRIVINQQSLLSTRIFGWSSSIA